MGQFAMPGSSCDTREPRWPESQSSLAVTSVRSAVPSRLPHTLPQRALTLPSLPPLPQLISRGRCRLALGCGSLPEGSSSRGSAMDGSLRDHTGAGHIIRYESLDTCFARSGDLSYVC